MGSDKLAKTIFDMFDWASGGRSAVKKRSYRDSVVQCKCLKQGQIFSANAMEMPEHFVAAVLFYSYRSVPGSRMGTLEILKKKRNKSTRFIFAKLSEAH
ncbi:unnamed protein product [Caenorhabditis bovis]|uniref:Uncharacterized protein n=1 Tax=Caenorhabditis bovis TaxID=2654633 RepID=A0A8S1ENX7_9PELO|nr:unnamed protein product [Caenorhabditis bovis]